MLVCQWGLTTWPSFLGINRQLFPATSRYFFAFPCPQPLIMTKMTCNKDCEISCTCITKLHGWAVNSEQWTKLFWFQNQCNKLYCALNIPPHVTTNCNTYTLRSIAHVPLGERSLGSGIIYFFTTSRVETVIAHVTSFNMEDMNEFHT